MILRSVFLPGKALHAGALLWACAALGGCQSALHPDYGAGGTDRYYESLLARELLRSSAVSGPSLASLSQMGRPQAVAGGAGGVREVVRIDDAGPATRSGLNPPATQPMTLDMARLIGRPTATLNSDEPVVNLTLQDAIARAMKHSLAIKVESYNPAIRESQVIEAMANFDPAVFGQSQWSVNDDPQISPSFSNGHTWSNQIGVKRILPIGTQIQATAGFNLRDIAMSAESEKTFEDEKSSYTANLNIQFTQPLLRGFGQDVNQANIYLAQRDVRISKSEFRRQVMIVLANVEEAYLTLVQARTNVETLERLVVASNQTYNDVVARIDIDATKAAIYQAYEALVSRKASLHQAQTDYRNASDRIKALINDPDLDVQSNLLVNPVDRPIADPIPYDALACIETGLRQRPELQQARLQVERSDIVIKVARNGLLPRVDLTLALQVNGLDHGLDQAAMRTINPMNALDATLGIKFEFPLGNREAEALLERRLNERRQALTNLVQAAQSVVQDIKQQLRAVLQSYEIIAYREEERQAAAECFEGIFELENIRARSPEFLQLKLDRQGRLAEAEQQLTRALIVYNLSIVKLEQAKGTLLEYDRVSLDQAPLQKENELLRLLRIPGSTLLAQ